MIYRLNKLVLIILMGILFQSCATIFGGRSNTFVINSSGPDSLQVYLDGEFIGTGPGKIKVGSREVQHGSKLTLKSNGVEVLNQTILRKPKTVYMILDVPLLGLPLGVDYATGQIHRPSPRKIDYFPNQNND